MRRLAPLRAVVADGDGISLPSDDAPTESADRLFVVGRLDYFVSVVPSRSPPGAVFRASTSGGGSPFVTAVFAALFHRSLGNRSECAVNLSLAIDELERGASRGARISGDSVSIPSDDEPDDSATRLYILAGDDYYVSVAPPTNGFPAGVPCFRACTSGTRNPFVTSMFAALFRGLRDDIEEARALLDCARLRVEQPPLADSNLPTVSEKMRLVKVPPDLYDGVSSTFFDATPEGMKLLGQRLADWLVDCEPAHGEELRLELVEMTKEEFDALPEV